MRPNTYVESSIATKNNKSTKKEVWFIHTSFLYTNLLRQIDKTPPSVKYRKGCRSLIFFKPMNKTIHFLNQRRAVFIHFKPFHSRRRQNICFQRNAVFEHMATIQHTFRNNWRIYKRRTSLEHKIAVHHPVRYHRSVDKKLTTVKHETAVFYSFWDFYFVAVGFISDIVYTTVFDFKLLVVIIKCAESSIIMFYHCAFSFLIKFLIPYSIY